MKKDLDFDDVYGLFKRQEKKNKEQRATGLIEQLSAEFEDFIFEAPEPLRRTTLGFQIDELDPVSSEETVDLHYNKLYKNYVEKFNQTGDEFQRAGAFLHQKFFEQLTVPHDGSLKNMQSLAFIKKNFDSFSKFKKEFKDKATSIQGDGWTALTRSGTITQISNHKVVSNLVLVIDMWEHAYLFDYKEDKNKWVDEFWKIVDWEIVGARI